MSIILSFFQASAILQAVAGVPRLQLLLEPVLPGGWSGDGTDLGATLGIGDEVNLVRSSVDGRHEFHGSAQSRSTVKTRDAVRAGLPQWKCNAGGASGILQVRI